MRRALAGAGLVAGLVLVAGCSGAPHPAGGGRGDAAPPGAAVSASASAPGPGDSAPAPGSDPTSAPARASAAAPAGDAAGPITVAFAGDVHFEGRTAARLNVRAPQQALGSISKQLADADLSMVNLETAITERGTPEAKTFTFRTPARSLKALQGSGVDLVSLANNHAVDYGQVGLTDTLAAKATSPIPIVGVGRDAQEAYAPYVTEVRGVKIAVLAASQVDEETNRHWRAGPGRPGIASALDEGALLEAVERARTQAPVVLVYLHWGQETNPCPTPAQTSLAAKLARAGVTAVVGTHAHTLLGAGMLGSTYVAYGFGNFLWYNSGSAASVETGVTRLTITGGKVTGEEFTPARIDGQGVPVPYTGAQAVAAAKRRDALRGCTGLAPVGR